MVLNVGGAIFVLLIFLLLKSYPDRHQCLKSSNIHKSDGGLIFPALCQSFDSREI